MSDQDMKNTLDSVDDQVPDIPPEPPVQENGTDGDGTVMEEQKAASEEILPEQPDYSYGEKGPESVPEPDYSYGGQGPESVPEPDYSYGGQGPESAPEPDYSYGGQGPESAPEPDYSYGGQGPESAPRPDYNYGQGQSQEHGPYPGAGPGNGWKEPGPDYGRRGQTPPPPPPRGPQPDYGHGQGYGRNPGQNYRAPQSPGKNSNYMATASLVLGILSVVLCCCGGFGIILGAIGIVLAILSRGREPMETSAKVGLGLSIGGIVLSIIVLVMAFAAMGNGGFSSDLYQRGGGHYGDYEHFEDYFEHYGL